MKPATVAPRPRPKLPATRRSAVDAARCSAGTRVNVRTWPAVPTNPKPAPPTAEQTKPCQGRSTNARPPQPSAFTTLPAIRIRFALKRSRSAPEGGVTTAAVPMTVANTSPAVAVEKRRTHVRARCSLCGDERDETDQERGQRRGHQHPTLLLHQLISDSRLCGRQRHRDAAKRTAGPFPTDLVSLTQ